MFFTIISPQHFFRLSLFSRSWLKNITDDLSSHDMGLLEVIEMQFRIDVPGSTHSGACCYYTEAVMLGLGLGLRPQNVGLGLGLALEGCGLGHGLGGCGLGLGLGLDALSLTTS